MKRLLLIAFTALSIHAVAQTNTFPSSGNVGIGTTNPQSALHLFSNSNSVQNMEGSSPYIYAGLQFTDGAQQTAGKVKQWAIWAGTDGGTWLSGLGFHRYDAVNPCVGGICDISLFLHDNGNVGIGTGNPQYKLDVNGNIRTNGSVFTNEIHFVANDMGATVDNSDPYTLRKIHDASNVSHLDLNLNDDGDESFRIYGNSCAGFGCGTYSGNLYHSFDASGNVFHAGNVGIGTQHPAYKLDVLGSIRAKEVLVNLDGGADFVFEKDYKLLPIEHVANYVQKNKHLPNIPSANEMVKNGVSMGDLQVKLLQKVEELTLYAIQQNKKIETLMKRIDELEAK